ncbi:MAG: hypothetical protein ACKOD9_02265, partial [Rubrivivax sp.]
MLLHHAVQRGLLGAVALVVGPVELGSLRARDLARRMSQTAAHLVDHVIPQVPVRQWVLSLPIP